MTTFSSPRFQAAIDLLLDGGLSYSKAEDLLTSVIHEAIDTLDEIETDYPNPPTDISDWEYDLCLDLIDKLTAGGIPFEHALLLVAMHASAVEERVEKRILS